jgi:hypothetical protein
LELKDEPNCLHVDKEFYDCAGVSIYYKLKMVVIGVRKLRDKFKTPIYLISSSEKDVNHGKSSC